MRNYFYIYYNLFVVLQFDSEHIIYRNMDQNKLLRLPIGDLHFSENFFLRSKLMGFHNLGEIMDTPVDVLVKKDDFNFTWLGELAKFLSDRGLLNLLQPLPGA